MASFLSSIFCFLSALLAMAFYTLFERKFLAHAQMRKGPNKVGVIGVPQPLADALKLFLKQQSTPLKANRGGFMVAPISSLVLTLLMWLLYPHSYSSFFIIFSALFFMVVSSLGVYPVLIAGWCSNSKYALLGTVRSIAQTISYEISMALFMLSVMMLFFSFSFTSFVVSFSVWVFVLVPPLASAWFVSILAETNRAPFDFAEGESELVSGFNVEYAAGPFAFIFMSEYANILIISVLSGAMFMGGGVYPVFGLFVYVFIAVLIIWVRAAYPRMRYDQLMGLTWKSFLPFSLMLLGGVACVMALFGGMFGE